MGGDWIEHAIGDIAEVVGGSTPSTKDASNFDGDIPWLTPKDLSGFHPRYVKRGSRNLSKKGLESCSARLIPTNSILLSSRAPIGYVAIAANPIATNQGFRSLILREDFDHEFVYYWLKLNTPELERHASGSTFKELSGSALKRIRIRLPRDKAEQRAIAHILGTLDDKIELNRQMNETLEAMAQALFKSWFIDFDPVVVNALRAGNPIPDNFAERAAHYRDNPDALGLPEDTLRLFPDRFQDSELGPIPEGWGVKSLNDIAKFLNGLACQKYPATQGGPNLPVIKIRELRQGISGNTDRATANVPRKYLVHDGDILFSWSGSLLIGIWTQGEGVLNQHVFKVSSKNYPKWFYYHWLDFHLVEFQRIASDKATTMGHIKRHHLADAKIIVPANEIMKLASDHISPIFHDIIENLIQNRSLAKLRDTLLPKLISGELRVPDAEKLLEDAL